MSKVSACPALSLQTPEEIEWHRKLRLAYDHVARGQSLRTVMRVYGVGYGTAQRWVKEVLASDSPEAEGLRRLAGFESEADPE